MKYFFSTIFTTAIISIIIISGYGCANIIPPSGGPRDTIPPRLINASPKDSATNVVTKTITLNFDEFVDVKSIQENLVVSPITKSIPNVDYKLRSVIVKFKDTLEPNTTYSLNFGDAIKDVNEGNIAKNFSYVFSTGATIANGSFGGKVVAAETGKIDSSLIVVLHKNLSDTAILKTKPRYYTKLDGKGAFKFKNVEPGTYAAFVIPNNYYKKFEDSTKPFAFLNTTITIGDTTASAIFYTYEEKRNKEGAGSFGTKLGTGISTKPTAVKEDKRLRYSNSLEGNLQDLLRNNIELTFTKPLTKFDSSKILLCDTLNKPLANYKVTLDSTKKIVQIVYNNWKEEMAFHLLILKEAMADSNGVSISKNDTIRFFTKKEAEYGSVRLRFGQIDLGKHPILQFVQSDKVTESVILTNNEFYRKLFKPGEYEIRVLFDTNKNGIWDSGNYSKKLQPEVVYLLKQKFNFKANWDNEVDGIVVP
ncbi:Ig-like domain-containing domain [Parasediminibacterium paludis]|uniref:Ig-like domain-containing domain n=1 Tax=Parasediminibacterium paludis TaxID=908966 RepID=A0ABV8PZ52_9BACT